MQEHPVPQNVTGYEFHLIGQMTLKQFFTAGLGVLFAIIVNATNLAEIFKYPLIFLFGVGGFGMAFVPYEGRSLDKWFIAFIRSIYQPTLFFWKKTNPVPDVFSYVQPKYIDTTPTVDYSGVRSQRAQEFLRTIPGTASAEQADTEDASASAILALFSQPAPKVSPQSTQQQSNPTVPVFQHTVHEVIIKPTNTTVVIDKQKEEVKKEVEQVITPAQIHEIVSPVKTADNTELNLTTQSNQLPFPKPPTKPNMIVGMTFTQDNKIIDNAIVEIVRKADGTPVRALKTNLLGQFSVITPLETGEYEIHVEKDGYAFDKTLLVLNNEVVQPLLIQAK
jgi:hypothetical protein